MLDVLLLDSNKLLLVDIDMRKIGYGSDDVVISDLIEAGIVVIFIAGGGEMFVKALSRIEVLLGLGLTLRQGREVYFDYREHYGLKMALSLAITLNFFSLLNFFFNSLTRL